MNFTMTQFSEVRRAGSSHPGLGRCPHRPGGGGSAQDAPRHPLLKLLEASQDRLTLLGRREGRDPLQRQEQRVAQYRDDHGHQPHSSDAASCEVGAQGEDAEDQAEYAVQ